MQIVPNMNNIFKAKSCKRVYLSIGTFFQNDISISIVDKNGSFCVTRIMF